MKLSLPTIRQWRLWSGVVIGVYVTFHLINHSFGMISLNAQEAARPWVMWFWHGWIGQILLYGSMIVHAALALYSLQARRHFRVPWSDYIQTILGLAIPYLLLAHIVNTRFTRVMAELDISYLYEINALWANPANRFKQITLVLLVWGHFVAGLHFWLRNYGWYKRMLPLMVVFYVMIPSASLIGFAQAGMPVTEQKRRDPAWSKAIAAQGTPKDKQVAERRIFLRDQLPNMWLGLVGVVFVYAQVRNFVQRRHRFSIHYPHDVTVAAPIGMSVLEVSRMIGLPHMSVCGGRARCTTCRVRITCQENLPAPNADEARALERIGAPKDMRLACQIRPRSDVHVVPLMNPHVLTAMRGKLPEMGKEQVLTVLFLDMRGSTRLAETRLPFDVVFVMNQFFEEMAEAVEQEGGLYSNFTGDGLMAIFGMRGGVNDAARSAVACGIDILRRMDDLNRRLSDELDRPIEIGVGIHTGDAIVGRMGPPRTPVITALGDTVNTAARLESLTKEMHRPIIISNDTLTAAGIADGAPLQEIVLRGRSAPILVAAMHQAEAFELFTRNEAGKPAVSG